MEVAIIQWKTIDSRIVVDDLYEHINAPKWADLDAWFCRPGCDHPKKVEDFFSEKERTPFSNSKIQRSASVSDIPLYQRSNRDATLKKRGANQPFGISNHRVIEDAENQEPNFSTLPQHKAKPGKGAITNQARIRNKKAGHERAPKLRSTLSARNLFSGTDLLSKFCNELKKLATRAHDRESAENVGENVVIVNMIEGKRGSHLLEKSEAMEAEKEEKKRRCREHHPDLCGGEGHQTFRSRGEITNPDLSSHSAMLLSNT